MIPKPEKERFDNQEDNSTSIEEISTLIRVPKEKIIKYLDKVGSRSHILNILVDLKMRRFNPNHPDYDNLVKQNNQEIIDLMEASDVDEELLVLACEIKPRIDKELDKQYIDLISGQRSDERNSEEVFKNKVKFFYTQFTPDERRKKVKIINELERFVGTGQINEIRLYQGSRPLTEAYFRISDDELKQFLEAIKNHGPIIRVLASKDWSTQTLEDFKPILESAEISRELIELCRKVIDEADRALSFLEQQSYFTAEKIPGKDSLSLEPDVDKSISFYKGEAEKRELVLKEINFYTSLI